MADACETGPDRDVVYIEADLSQSVAGIPGCGERLRHIDSSEINTIRNRELRTALELADAAQVLLGGGSRQFEVCASYIKNPCIAEPQPLSVTSCFPNDIMDLLRRVSS